MALTDTQIDLLREVIAGKMIFAPKSNSGEDIDAFQVLAEELVELDENGYLTGSRAHRQSYTGKQQIVRVVVKGVTAKGRRSLQSEITTPAKVSYDQGILCPHCNYSLRPTAKFCDECGSSVSPGLDSTLTMPPIAVSASTDSFFGLILRGKYQIIGEIGKGGMGQVYRAKHTPLSILR